MWNGLEVISDEAGLSRHLTVRALQVSSLRGEGPTYPLWGSSRRGPRQSPTWDARPQCVQPRGKAHPGAQRGTTFDQVTQALGRGWWASEKGFHAEKQRGFQCDLLELKGREVKWHRERLGVCVVSIY